MADTYVQIFCPVCREDQPFKISGERDALGHVLIECAACGSSMTLD